MPAGCAREQPRKCWQRCVTPVSTCWPGWTAPAARRPCAGSTPTPRRLSNSCSPPPLNNGTALLGVLDRPAVPLHNNGTESIIRGYVKTRESSGSTRRETGRCCRDTFASLQKTCRKLGVSFGADLGDRLRGLGQSARLAKLVRERAGAATAALGAAVPV